MTSLLRAALVLTCCILLSLTVFGCRETERTTEDETTTVVLPPVPSDTATGGAIGTAALDMTHPGRTAFESLRCTMCHSVSSANLSAASEVGPDLAGVGGRRQDLASFIQSNDHPSAWQGTSEQAQLIAEWLAQQ